MKNFKTILSFVVIAFSGAVAKAALEDISKGKPEGVYFIIGIIFFSILFFCYWCYTEYKKSIEKYINNKN